MKVLAFTIYNNRKTIDFSAILYYNIKKGRQGIPMKCRRIEMEADVVKYEPGKGLEDGFELWADVVTKVWIVTDTLIKVKNEDGFFVCPYITHRRGRTFIHENDYIIIDADGTKHVCGEDKVFKRYEKIE